MVLRRTRAGKPRGPSIAFTVGENVRPFIPVSLMLFGFIDRVTSAPSLKTALDRSVERSRSIADRVSKATLQNSDGFSLDATGRNAAQGGNPVNVEDEMVALADEQIRFLATSRLLEKTYASLRGAIKGSSV